MELIFTAMALGKKQRILFTESFPMAASELNF